MYISRKRKRVHAPLTPNNSAHTPLTPGNSAETALTPVSAQSAYTPIAAVNSLPSEPREERTAPPEGMEEQREEAPLPEAQVELINGEGSNLGSAPDTSDLTYEQFLAANPSTGVLRVQAYIGRQGLPVPGAFVTVSAPFKDGEKVFYAVRTNADGVADNMVLPAPDRASSQVPGSDNPFAVYTVTVSHPSYRTAVFSGVPVFAGVKSIQPVAFLPQIEVN